MRRRLVAIVSAVVGIAVSMAVFVGLGAMAEDAPLDPTFGIGGIAGIPYTGLFAVGTSGTDLERLPDGSFYFAGGKPVSSGGPFVEAFVAKFTGAGVLDTAFGTGGIALTGRTVGGDIDVEVAPSGSPVLATGNYIARFTPTGLPDTSFSGDGFFETGLTTGGGLGVLTDGSVITTAGTTLLKLTPLGTTDATFGAGGSVSVAPSGSATDLLIRSSDSKVIVTVAVTSPIPQSIVASYTFNGLADGSFGTAGRTTLAGFGPRLIGIQPDGKIVVAVGTILRLTATGQNDATFTAISPVGVVVGVTSDSTGRIVVMSKETTPAPGVVIARYSAQGVVETNFGTNGFQRPGIIPLFGEEAVLVQPDGKIVFSGTSRLTGAVTTGTFLSDPKHYIARLIPPEDVTTTTTTTTTLPPSEDAVSVAFSGTKSYQNSGTVTSGGFTVRRAGGVVTGVGGRATIPSTSGTGNATIGMGINQIAPFPLWIGEVGVSDPGAAFGASTFVILGRIGGTPPVAGGRSDWINFDFNNLGPYTLTWTVTDVTP